MRRAADAMQVLLLKCQENCSAWRRIHTLGVRDVRGKRRAQTFELSRCYSRQLRNAWTRLNCIPPKRRITGIHGPRNKGWHRCKLMQTALTSHFQHALQQRREGFLVLMLLLFAPNSPGPRCASDQKSLCSNPHAGADTISCCEGQRFTQFKKRCSRNECWAKVHDDDGRGKTAEALDAAAV